MSLRGHVNCCRCTRALCCITDVNQWMTANRLISSIRRRRNFCSLVPDIPCANYIGKEVVGQLSTSALTPSRLAVIYDSLELSCMSSDLSLEKHVSVVSAACFFHQFVVSGSPWSRSQQQHSSMHLWLLALTYCNAVLAGSPKVTTDKLQRVMNSAARRPRR